MARESERTSVLLSEYRRQVVDVVDLVRRLHQEIEASKGKSQFEKGLRKAQMIALELARPHDLERAGDLYRVDTGWRCSVCDLFTDKLVRYCNGCGARMFNYESEKLKYED